MDTSKIVEPFQPAKSELPSTAYVDQVVLSTIELGERRILSIYKQTGISPKVVQAAIDRLMLQNKVVVVKGEYFSKGEISQ